ncbi:MAG: hypothetical protein VX589_09060 [Myxococcota bacterium]|nr:hypothetical protein [Myxococcota bacterium]
MIHLNTPIRLVFVALAFIGCDDDDGQTRDADMMVEPMEGLLRDTGGASDTNTAGAMMPTAGTSANNEGTDTEAAGSATGGGMMSIGGNAPPMYPPPRPVSDCMGACARYAECDRVDIVFGEGGEGACLERCERATRLGDEAAELWWQCLSEDPCNVVNRCPLPSVDPLSCTEVCGLVDRCDGVVDVGECEATCAANEEPFRECGETLFGQCDPDAFKRCLASEVYPTCGAYCAAAVGCNIIIADGCEDECIDRYIARDPLALSTFERVNECVQSASMMADCQAMDACVKPFNFDPPPSPPNDAFCGRFQACDFGLFESDCQMEYESALRQGPYYLNCIFEGLDGECPQFFFQLKGACEEQGSREIAEACNRFCLAEESCGADPEFDLAECSMMCQMNFTNDPDENERVQSVVGCIQAETCPAFEACREAASPEGQCTRFCESRSACGEVEDDCETQCNANWPRNRHAAWRACVEQANADCDVINACVLAPTVPCDEACAKKAACNIETDRCVEICDDRQFENPIDVALEVACILAAPECDGDDPLTVSACMVDPLVAGTECLNYCRAKTNCDPNGDLAGCLTPCVTGFSDVDGLFFDASRACLGALEADANCEALAACVPETVEVDCNEYCAQVTACNIERPACVAECEAEPPLDRAGCVLESIRTRQRCGGIARCEGVAPPQVSAECRQYCREQANCNDDVDTYLCELECADNPAYLPYRLACIESTQCEGQAACLTLEAVPDPRCDEPCATLNACMALELDACNAICTGQLASPETPDDYLSTLRQCLNDARDDMGTCDGALAATCLDPKWCDVIENPVRVPSTGGLIPFDISGGPEGPAGTCGGGQSQFAMIIHVPTLSNASFTITESDFDTVLTLRRDCNDVMSEVACNDDANGLQSRIPREAGTTILLPAGTYFLIIDVFRRLFGENGSGIINITLDPVEPPEPIGGMSSGGQPAAGVPSGGQSGADEPAAGQSMSVDEGGTTGGEATEGGTTDQDGGGTTDQDSGGTPSAGAPAGGTDGGDPPGEGTASGGTANGGAIADDNARGGAPNAQPIGGDLGGNAEGGAGGTVGVMVGGQMIGGTESGGDPMAGTAGASEVTAGAPGLDDDNLRPAGRPSGGAITEGVGGQSGAGQAVGGRGESRPMGGRDEDGAPAPPMAGSSGGAGLAAGGMPNR